MNQVTSKEHDPDMLDEYDFSKGIRGKYAERYHAGKNMIRLDDDSAKRRMDMKLRFSESEIQQWAERYNSGSTDEAYFVEISPKIQAQGYLDKELLKRIARWKSPRRAGLIEKNDDDYIKDLTSFAFSATSERARIEVLLLLDGVGWPTASVTLHLFHKDPYPILDFRAMWSIGLDDYTYSSSFWSDYTSFCREITSCNQIDMRTLDKALWQYSKENQKD